MSLIVSFPCHCHCAVRMCETVTRRIASVLYVYIATWGSRRKRFLLHHSSSSVLSTLSSLLVSLAGLLSFLWTPFLLTRAILTTFFILFSLDFSFHETNIMTAHIIIAAQGVALWWPSPSTPCESYIIVALANTILSAVLNAYLSRRHAIRNVDDGSSFPSNDYVWPNGQGDAAKFLDGQKNSEAVGGNFRLDLPSLVGHDS